MEDWSHRAGGSWLWRKHPGRLVRSVVQKSRQGAMTLLPRKGQENPEPLPSLGNAWSKGTQCIWHLETTIAFQHSSSIKKKWSRSAVSDSLRPHELGPTRILRPWDFPGKSTGVGCHFLLQGIFPTQGSNPGLPHCRQMLYHLSHQGSPMYIYT